MAEQLPELFERCLLDDVSPEEAEFYNIHNGCTNPLYVDGIGPL